MRKLPLLPIIVSLVLFGLVVFFSFFLSAQIYYLLSPNDFRPIITFFLGIIIFYLSGLLIFRIFFILFPLKSGQIDPGTSQNFISTVNVLFILVFFDPIFMNPLIPVFLLNPLYQWLGARIGDNTFVNGKILDPSFVAIGKNTILGMESVLIPHSLDGPRLAYHPIIIGDNVTIGARAIINAGVTIGNNAIVAMGAVVPKHTVIKENEVWGGVPAHRIEKY